MKTPNIIVTSLVVIGFVAVLGLFFPVLHQTQLANSVAGATNSTARIASCVLDLSTTTPTTATTTATGCLYNSDSSDRIVSSIEMSFDGVTSNTYNGGGFATSTMALSTSTTQWATTSPNVLLNTSQATTTVLAPAGNWYLATSSPGIVGTGSIAGTGGSTNDFARRWKSGSYLNLSQIGTSTAQGVIVVKYFISD